MLDRVQCVLQWFNILLLVYLVLRDLLCLNKGIKVSTVGEDVCYLMSAGVINLVPPECVLALLCGKATSVY